MSFLYYISAIIQLLICTSLYAQIPPNYYTPADDLFGEQLKSALHNIITDHTQFPYTSTSTDVWDILKQADADPDNPDNVILIYTGRSVNGEQEYNNGSGWNREHIWAKSRGDFGTSKGPGTDCHALRAADISVNSTRNNRFFAEGGNEVWDEGVFTGCYVGTSQYTFEPRDEIKGDIARMIFYMAVRYEGESTYPDLELTEDILPQEDTQPLFGSKSTLLRWHLNDSVDETERTRNNVVYSYQGNRNPFIDHPEYVEKIWSTTVSNYETIETPQLTVTRITGTHTYQVTSTIPIHILEVYNLLSQKLLTKNIDGTYTSQYTSTQQNPIHILVINHQTQIKVLQ